jgi:outer membrane protein TolC
MELLLAVAALVLGIVALVFGLQARDGLRGLRTELEQVRTQLDEARTELARLQETPPAPPLPKTRHAGLDDLREQLRAAHRESAENAEE